MLQQRTSVGFIEILSNRLNTNLCISGEVEGNYCLQNVKSEEAGVCLLSAPLNQLNLILKTGEFDDRTPLVLHATKLASMKVSREKP